MGAVKVWRKERTARSAHSQQVPSNSCHRVLELDSGKGERKPQDLPGLFRAVPLLPSKWFGLLCPALKLTLAQSTCNSRVYPWPEFKEVTEVWLGAPTHQGPISRANPSHLTWNTPPTPAIFSSVIQNPGFSDEDMENRRPGWASHRILMNPGCKALTLSSLTLRFHNPTQQPTKEKRCWQHCWGG